VVITLLVLDNSLLGSKVVGEACDGIIELGNVPLVDGTNGSDELLAIESSGSG
jgi:hypothetical protein